MNVYPFIEAEKAQQRNVKRACELLKVSRSAFYQHLAGPSRRERAMPSSPSEIQAVHAGVRRAATARRGCTPQLRAAGPPARPQAGRPDHAPGRPARPGGEAVEADHHRRPGGRGPRGPGPPRLHRRRRQRSTPAGAATSPTSRTWEGWLYLATVIDIASRRVVGYAMADHLRTELVAGALANAVAARDPAAGRDLPLRPGLPVHLRRVRRPRRGLPGRAVARPHRPVLGQRPRRDRSSAPSKASCIDLQPWPTRAGARRPSSSTSAGTTAPGCTAPSATSAPPNSKPATTTRIKKVA